LRASIDEALRKVRRSGQVAILCLDLDRFKAVNDTLGHPAGDELLKAVAKRLRGSARETDTVARIGGNEFAIVQVGGDQPKDATVLAQRLCDILKRPFHLDGHQVVVGASVGIAMGAIGSDAAIETADIALMTDDLTKLPWLVGHARRTLSVIQQNIGFSLGLKLVFVVLTFAGVATLWGAIAADVGASLLVVANALRLLRARQG